MSRYMSRTVLAYLVLYSALYIILFRERRVQYYNYDMIYFNFHQFYIYSYYDIICKRIISPP